MVSSIGGMGLVHCMEVVRFSESPLLEVSLYFVVSLIHMQLFMIVKVEEKPLLRLVF